MVANLKIDAVWPNNALQPTPLALRARGSLASLGAAERGRWTAFLQFTNEAHT